ncbi:MAG: tyrosine-type recombinase/integrase [Gemmatimonadetes bacterium]|nr:tyrosine-type recombinase/integrase [Gemmatimonadota bacterium]
MALTAAKVRGLTKPGAYGDGRGGCGLSLRVHRTTTGEVTKRWIQRIRVNGKVTNIGLGAYPAVSLAEARAVAFRNADEPSGKARPGVAIVPTVREMLDEVIEVHRGGWRHPERHAQTWRRSMRTYAFPRIGDMPVSEVTPSHVLDCLLPVWQTKPTAARQVRQRIGTVMKLAVARGYRQDNPAGEVLGAALPKQDRGGHYDAVPHGEVWDTIQRVRALLRMSDPPKLALEFLVLTAARSVEVRGANWGEVDLEAAVWTLPASRMKTRREHRVPLSAAAQAVLRQATWRRSSGGLVFPSQRTGRRIGTAALGSVLRAAGGGGTVHGFRSSFRDWAAEKTEHPREVVEAALAHTVQNRVEAAYRRTDYLDRRCDLMEAWGRYAAPTPRPLG